MTDRPDIPTEVSEAAFRAAGVKLSSAEPPSPQALGEAVDAALQAAAPALRKQGAEEALAAAKSICPACGRVGSGTGACRCCSAEGEATMLISDVLAELKRVAEIEAELHSRDEEQDAIRRQGAEEERERLREAFMPGDKSMLAWGGRKLLIGPETFERIFAALHTPAPSEPGD